MNAQLSTNLNSTFSSFQNNDSQKRRYVSIPLSQNVLLSEHSSVPKSQVKVTPKSKAIVLGSTIIGTLVPIAFFAKKQKKEAFNLKSLKGFKEMFNIHYGITEMTVVSAASIVSGVVGGIYSDKNHNKTHKIKEGVFQFMNATVPTLIVGGVMKAMEKSKKLKDNMPAKIGGVIGGLAIGMPLAAAVANRINDPNDEEPDRKIGLKDMIVSLDDALGALVLAKIPFVDKLHAEKFLPVIFGWCGYRAGQHK